MLQKDVRSKLQDLYRIAVNSVQPQNFITEFLSIGTQSLDVTDGKGETRTFSLSSDCGVHLFGAGKGAGSMGAAVASVIGKRIRGGCIIVPSQQGIDIPRVSVLEGEHPNPRAGSVAATQAMMAMVSNLRASDIALFCLTGGASSLLVCPPEGISLMDKAKTNQELLNSGADISSVNIVRKHLSVIKGGQLSRLAWPARVAALILSDVVGDNTSVIGSGPTSPDNSTFVDALNVVRDYNLERRLPKLVIDRLTLGAAGLLSETPKLGDGVFSRTFNVVVGSNKKALLAAHEANGRNALKSVYLEELIVGDTYAAARLFANHVREVIRDCSAVTCLIAGGETTVNVRGPGKGGRNQEFALIVARELRGIGNWSLLSAGTDGIDGPTDAAGAFVTQTTLENGERIGMNATQFLEENNTYRYFSELGDLFCPGPTGTNVMDIKIAIVFPSVAQLPHSQ